MKEQNHVLKLSLLAGSVALFAAGCASSGYARYDNDKSATRHDVGASASADVGSASAGVSASADAKKMDSKHAMKSDHRSSKETIAIVDDEAEGEARQTVTALSFMPVTGAWEMNKFPFYDWNLRSIDLYTFAVPDPNLTVTTRADLPEFREDLPVGSVYVESAGGKGEVRAGKVIQHSPNPGTSGF